MVVGTTIISLLKGLYKLCSCGCNILLLIIDKKGRIRRYISGHNWRNKQRNRGTKACHWKGGFRETNNGKYLEIYNPDHPFSNSHRYQRYHRYVYEQFYKCMLLSYTIIHHIDGNTRNNDIVNLEPIIGNIKHLADKHNRKDKTKRLCKYCNDKTLVRLNGTEVWIGNDKDGFICNRCYCKVKRIGKLL